MTRVDATLGGASPRPAPWLPRALGSEDRRHLTRFLARYCAAPALLDACVAGEGPLPGVMDRLVCRVVDIHRQLSGGTYVDAGEALDIHPQSLRVLAKKVQERSEGGAFLVGEPPSGAMRWRVILEAVLEGVGHIDLDGLVELMAPWEGPVDPDLLGTSVHGWLQEGWLRRTSDGQLSLLSPSRNGDDLLRRARSALVAELSVDMGAAYLTQPFEKPGQPLMVRDVNTRGVFPRANFAEIVADFEKHLRNTVHKAHARYVGRGGERVPVCVSLGMSRPESRGFLHAGENERELWLNATARHLARQGGLREAMPILYQEVARELRRRSTQRAYDPELLEAVGRARQNVHEWEAGRGYHFRGPAPLTVAEDGGDVPSESHLRQAIFQFVVERSHRTCSLDEIMTGVQKSEGVKLESAYALRLLEEECTTGDIRQVKQGGQLSWQSTRTFRRGSAQDMAARRAKMDNVFRRLPSQIVGLSRGLADHSNLLLMVDLPRENVAFFVRDVAETEMEYHAQVTQPFVALEPDEIEGFDAQAELIVAPIASMARPPGLN